MQRNLHKTFNTLNIGFKGVSPKKEVVLTLRKPSFELKLLHILQREGFIDYWHTNKTEKVLENRKSLADHLSVKIKFKPSQGGPRFHIATVKTKRNLSVKELYAYNHHRGFNCLLLTTSRGILTHRECLFYKVGGLALCEIQLKYN